MHHQRKQPCIFGNPQQGDVQQRTFAQAHAYLGKFGNSILQIRHVASAPVFFRDADAHLGQDHLQGDGVGHELALLDQRQREPTQHALQRAARLEPVDRERLAQQRRPLRVAVLLEHHHPQYTPLEKLDDEAIKSAGLRMMDPSADNAFMKKSVPPPELKKKGGKVFVSG